MNEISRMDETRAELTVAMIEFLKYLKYLIKFNIKICVMCKCGTGIKRFMLISIFVL